MVKKLSEIEYKKLLNRCFWGMVNKGGLSRDMADNFINSLYPGRSVSMLSADELQAACFDLRKKLNIDYGIPRRPEPKKRTWQPSPPPFPTGGRKKKTARQPKQKYMRKLPQPNEPATILQIQKMNTLANELNMPDVTLIDLLEKAGGGNGKPTTVLVVQKIIEALKAMKKRGWKPEPKPEPKKPEPKQKSFVWTVGKVGNG